MWSAAAADQRLPGWRRVMVADGGAMTDDALLHAGWREAVHTVGGIQLHVVEAGPRQALLLILLHGFPEFWWAWRKQIAPFAAAGYRVLVPDMRGYSASDAPQDVSAYQLDTLAADVLALADAAGAQRFHLVGHDWGAVVAWWVAARHPGRLDRVVVMDGPHPDVWARQALKHPTQALRSTYVAFFQLPWLPEAALGASTLQACAPWCRPAPKPTPSSPLHWTVMSTPGRGRAG